MSSLWRGLRPNLMVFPRLTTSPCPRTLRLLLRPQQHSSPPTRIRQTIRAFSKTCRASAKASRPLGAARPAVRQTGTTLAPSSAATSFAQQLAAKGVPTILFEAPSHKWYIGSCLTAGFFMMAFGTYWYWAGVLYSPEGLSSVVRWTFSGLVFFCGAMGTFFISGALGVVSLVRVVPRAYAVSKMPKLMAKPPASSASAQPDALLIEVSTRRMVPFVGPRRVLVPPDKIELSPNTQKLLVKRAGGEGGGGVDSAKAHRDKRAEMARREEARQYELAHIMSAPFRHFYQALKFAYVGLRRGLTRDGFQTILVDGRRCKLDVHGGWAMEDGRALVRVLPAKSRPL